MTAFESRTVTFRGTVQARAGADDLFPLFSPEGERSWVPHWDPEPVHPAGSSWEEGSVFRTREPSGEAVWIVTRLDRVHSCVTYHRVEPERYVARIDVRCRALDEASSEAAVTYSFVGLSETGNREIEAMTQADFDKKMERWAGWLGDHLASR